MTKKTYRVTQRALLLSGCAFFSVSGFALAQDQFEPTAEAEVAIPLFDMSPLFSEGVFRLFPSDGKPIMLERSGNYAYLKFSDDAEVWALSIAPGPGNSELFKNDLERLFLRLSDRGNLSLYTPSYPGEPVGVTDMKSAIDRPELEGNNFSSRLSDHLSIRAHKIIEVEIEDAPNKQIVWLQDAARIAAKAVLKTQGEDAGIRKIRVTRADFADVMISDDGVLTVSVNPSQEFQGRPSSDRVIAFIRNSFDS